ncbi:MAG: hypothetical protein KJ000_06015 [Pirellulaceae bacterium]|nr:hypothetical protein [Pirellulaceae bacterium]
MSEQPAAFLLDNSVQIKRLISAKWRRAGHDALWNDVTPVVSTYTFMEFKSTVIAALQYLVDVLREAVIASGDAPDSAQLRLEEVIRHLTVDTLIVEGDRRVRIAVAYATRFFAENELFPRLRTLGELIDRILVEAENLEKIWFRRFATNGKTETMRCLDNVNCYIGRNETPLVAGRGGFHCSVQKFACNVVGILENRFFEIDRGVQSKELKLKSTRLRKGLEDWKEAVTSEKVADGLSIGEKLCRPIGDMVIVCKAHDGDVGLITADRDQAKLAVHMRVRCLFYDLNSNTFLEAGTAESE